MLLPEYDKVCVSICACVRGVCVCACVCTRTYTGMHFYSFLHTFFYYLVYTLEICCLFIGIGGKLRQLEGLFIGGSVQGGRVDRTISIETLIDVLLVLYDECCNSSLRREKTVSDFIEFGKESCFF